MENVSARRVGVKGAVHVTKAGGGADPRFQVVWRENKLEPDGLRKGCDEIEPGVHPLCTMPQITGLKRGLPLSHVCHLKAGVIRSSPWFGVLKPVLSLGSSHTLLFLGGMFRSCHLVMQLFASQ